MDRCMLAHQTSGNLRIFSLKNNVPEMFLEKLWDAQYSVRFLILLFYAKIEKLTHFKNCEISDTQKGMVTDPSITTDVEDFYVVNLI